MAERKNGKDGFGKPIKESIPTIQPRATKLGQKLRELSDRALASGTKTLTLDQIHARISETRGGTA